MRNLFFALLSLTVVPSAQAAEIPLYPTGPSEDAAFLRFVNAGDGALQLVADGSEARLQLDAATPVSNYLTVGSDKPIKGQFLYSSKAYPLELSVKPGEFATVVGIPTAENTLQTIVVSEVPDDFNGLKASLAFYSLDSNCAAASLLVAGRNVELFKTVANGSLERRSINPVKLSVQLRCADALVGEPLALGQLQAGARYSIFLVPSAQGPRLFQALDTLAN